MRAMRTDESISTPPPALKRRLRHLLEGALQISGVGGLYARMRRVRGAVAFMYHSVAGTESAQWIDPCNRIDPETFAKQMRMLSQRRRVVSMTQLVETLGRGETPEAGTVAITFDDGYLDNLSVAAPILSELGLPATLYLPTGYVERGEPQWIDRLYSAFRTRSRHALTISDAAGSPFDLRQRVERQHAYRIISERLLATGADERRAILEAVEEQLRPTAPPPRLTMNWDDVRQLVAEHLTIEIGIHTREHIDLTACDPATMEAEIRSCIEDVRREIGVRPVHFSFPYGRWSTDAARLLRTLGLRSAVGSSENCLLRAGADPFRLPRVEAPASMPRFRFVTSGAHPALPRLLVDSLRRRRPTISTNGRTEAVPLCEGGR